MFGLREYLVKRGIPKHPITDIDGLASTIIIHLLFSPLSTRSTTAFSNFFW
jgi:hypothetical protein